ncbi:TetR/AcrR family transcriptional regulator [Xylophilus sp. GW821-FHT01B05]
MSLPQPRTNAKERLIEAAMEIISAQGVQELTLEGVAAIAGVTKGGLIYHFKTKDELLGALVTHMLEQHKLRTAHVGHAAKSLLNAWVDEALDMSPTEKQLRANLLTAAANHPHLVGPVREQYERGYRDIQKLASNEGLALVIAVATDGIALVEMLNLCQFTPAQRTAMRSALAALVQQID